jgi:hypothetical protein
MEEPHTGRDQLAKCPQCRAPLRAIASIRSAESWQVLLSCEVCAFATKYESPADPFAARRIGGNHLGPLGERNGTQ